MARKRKEDKGADGAAWLTVYADTMSVLMAFFVMLYAMSSVEEAKFHAFVAGLAVPFGNETGLGLLPANNGLVDKSLPLPFDSVGTAEGDEGPDIEDGTTTTSLEEAMEALERDIAEAGLDGLIEQRREERGVVVSIASDDVLFALGSAEISELGHRTIDTVAGPLLALGHRLLVEGHTDNLPLRGRPGYDNWNLSGDRAVAVLRVLVDEHGFPPDQIAMAGFGEHQPIAPNTDDASRARNRRVDIVILSEEIRQ